MHIHIVTLFPEFFSGPLQCGLMQKAREAGIIRFSLHNPRDFATDKHRTVDDRPYGGGPGMVMLPGPLSATLRSLGYGPRGDEQPGPLLMLTPGGKSFTQATARQLAATQLQPAHATEAGSAEPVITLICGRYEGPDARIEEIFPVESYCIGDFVLNGGETAALCLIESVARLLPGFMGHEESGDEESFSAGLLEYPHYTRPENFEGHHVPEILLTGDHARTARWRRQASLLRTLAFRPDMLEKAPLNNDDRSFLRGMAVERPGRNLYCALVHHPVLDKDEKSVAVSLTNLDIHDIARSSCAYGLGAYYVLTPLKDQRELLESILSHWTEGPGSRSNPDRKQALRLVKGGANVEEAIADIRERTGQEPMVIATSARADADAPPGISFSGIANVLRERPVLLLLGTGQGLAPEVFRLCEASASPLRWQGAYNHLSVRSALAIMLDRILGDWL